MIRVFGLKKTAWVGTSVTTAMGVKDNFVRTLCNPSCYYDKLPPNQMLETPWQYNVG
jgi:hypothetical protein